MTWILLFVIIILVYVFGWTSLLYLAGASILLGIVLAVFEPSPSGGSSGDWITFSFTQDEDIETVAAKLKTEFSLGD
ncbi:MAG: hypothetical protein ABGY43_21660 [bacterium]|nr:hypothetical protein [Gammaproteobacteria bacterium]